MEFNFKKTLFMVFPILVTLFFCMLRNINCARNKRTLAFTRGNSFGYLAAVAIPVDLPNRNIYVAFNLETNYGLPPNDTHYNLINKWNLSGMFSDVDNDVTHIDGGRKHRSLYTRRDFYRCVSGYLELFGMNGTECLLRTICEVAEFNLYASNGVLGSIFHVLFMPSSSADENIPPSIYEAEELGQKNRCYTYQNTCPEGFLSKISIVL